MVDIDKLKLIDYWYNYTNPNPPALETHDIVELARMSSLTWVRYVFVFKDEDGTQIQVENEVSPMLFKSIRFDQKTNLPLTKSVINLQELLERDAKNEIISLHF